MFSLDSTEKVISIISGVASIILFLLRKVLVPYYKKAVSHIVKWFKVLKRLDGIDSSIKLSENLTLLNNHLIKILVDKYDVGLFICDTSGACIWTNEALQKIFGGGAADMLGDGWLNFLHPDDVKKVFQAWKDAVSSWYPYKIRYRIISNKNIIECESTCEVVRDISKTPVFYVGEVSIL